MKYRPDSFGHDPWWLVLGKALAIFVFLMLNVLVAILVERKILGWMQLRPGPNRVGPWGALQSLADGIKLALKESITPARRRQVRVPCGAGHLGRSPRSPRSRSSRSAPRCRCSATARRCS